MAQTKKASKKKSVPRTSKGATSRSGRKNAPKNALYSPKAQLERPSGKPGTEPGEIGRSPFRKDYARLLHASSFRRLQGKTQLYPGVESDFFRNRLTHSLEVAQIARGIAARLNVVSPLARGLIDEDLVEFAAIAHDLGHPPFGHNGEHALDELMIDHGGFEGNAQTLRILAAVERKSVRLSNGDESAAYGLDLTYRSLASVLKYDREIPLRRAKGEDLVKGYYLSESDLVTKIKEKVAPGFTGEFKTVECAIMDIADDIAYSTYDLEDSLHAGFVTPMSLAYALLSNNAVAEEVKRKSNKALAKCSYALVESVSELVGVVADVFGVGMLPTAELLTDSSAEVTTSHLVMMNIEAWKADKAFSGGLVRTRLTAGRVGRLISSVELVPNAKFPQMSGVKLGRAELLQVEVMKHLNYELVVRSSRLAVVEHRGKDVVSRIFQTLLISEGRLLPEDWRIRFEEARGQSEVACHRVICDYVAGMTDRYAAELYQRLFDEGPTMFKPL